MDVTDHDVCIGEYESGTRLSFHANTHTAMPRRSITISYLRNVIQVDFIRNRVTVSSGLKSMGAEIRDFPEPTDSHYGGDGPLADRIVEAVRTGDSSFSNGFHGIEAGLSVMGMDRSRDEGVVFDYKPYWLELDASRVHMR